ncbi:hypothetical protein WA158_002324 [Blastocystis sp. Blastoise]
MNSASRSMTSQALENELSAYERKEHPILSKETKKIMMRNIYLISIAFCCIILGVKIVSSFATPLLGDLGATSIALLNYGAGLSFIVIPTVLSWFKSPKVAILIFAPEYFIYVLTFSYLIPTLNLIWSLIHGFCASILWTCEILFLAENSTDEDRGWKSGVFWGIYMSGSIVGNIFAWYFLNYIGYDSTLKQGWLGNLSIMFIIFAAIDALGCIPLFFMKSIARNTQEMPKTKDSGYKRFKLLIKSFINPKVMILSGVSIFWGIEFSFVGGMFNRQVIDRANIGLVVAYNSLIQVISSFILGRTIDKYGHYVVMVACNISMLLGLGSSIIANDTQDWWLFFASTFFAIADTGYQTIVPVLITQYYDDKNSTNAVFRLLQGIFCGSWYMIAPLFVKDGSTRCTSDMYILECIICVIFLVLSQLSYSLFYQFFAKKQQLKQHKSHTIKPIEDNHLDSDKTATIEVNDAKNLSDNLEKPTCSNEIIDSKEIVPPHFPNPSINPNSST